jgi:hypothetical protein
MTVAELPGREIGLANYIIDKNKAELNRISKDCVSPIVEIRKACSKTAADIGHNELKEEEPLTHDEWVRITESIYDTFFKS